MFSGCTSSDTDHAITVVGYGTADNGEKYWLIKNSWSVSDSSVVMIVHTLSGALTGERVVTSGSRGAWACAALARPSPPWSVRRSPLI